MDENCCYVYVYLDPSKKGNYSYEGLPFSFLYEPFYVGKGRGIRMYAHINEAKRRNKNPKHKRIANIVDGGFDMREFIIKVDTDLTDDEAFALEKEYINSIGRSVATGGPLLNYAEGGHYKKSGAPPKLSKADREEAATLYLAGWCCQKIGKKFDVTFGTIARAIKDEGVELRKRRDVSQEEISNMVDMYISGSSISTVAKMLGIGHKHTANLLVKAGVVFRSTVKIHDVPDETRDYIINKYVSGESTSSLALEFDVNRKTIVHFLRKQGIEIIKRGLPQSVKNEIIIKHQNGCLGVELAEEYNVSKDTIYKFLRNKNKSVTTP